MNPREQMPVLPNEMAEWLKQFRDFPPPPGSCADACYRALVELQRRREADPKAPGE